MPFCGYAVPVATQAWEMTNPHTRHVHRISVSTSHVPEGYSLVKTGYDVEWTGDGTTGRGKEPFASLEEAIEFARLWNEQRVKSYLDVNRAPPPLELHAPVSAEMRQRVSAVSRGWGRPPAR